MGETGGFIGLTQRHSATETEAVTLPNYLKDSMLSAAVSNVR